MKLLRLFFFVSLLIATSMLSAWNISAQAPPPTPVGPLKSDEPPPQVPSKIERLAPGEFSVDSKVGWQQTSLSLQKGDTFKIKYISGTWTVDFRSFTYVGPKGYTPKEDKQIFQGCKLNSSWVYGRLVGKVGNGEIFPVDQGGSFKANASGDLSLRIHDVDACLVDNDGSVVVEVTADGQVPSMKLPWDSSLNGTIYLSGGPHGGKFDNTCSGLRVVSKMSGVDFGMILGTPVLAVAQGTVVFAGPVGTSHPGRPNVVKIDHGGGFITQYWHLKEIDQSILDAVSPNGSISLPVSQGRVLGASGQQDPTGGPHLHLEFSSQAHDMVIDEYIIHAFIQTSKPQKGFNYQGTMTLGAESFQVLSFCGSEIKKWDGSAATIEAISNGTGGYPVSSNSVAP